MTDILIRTEGHAGRITLNRPDVLNALTWDMCRDIHTALDTWRDDPSVKLLIIDAAGDRAFCAGGDITDIYAAAQRKDHDYSRRFWADEYRMNAALFHFPKPVVTFLHGYTMGGGVGVGCHGSHRITCETSKIAMPEVGIGLTPDVGGSLILALAPGRLGEYLGLTADRMDAGDAIYAGFADYFVPHAGWDSLKQTLITTGDWNAIDAAAAPPLTSRLAAWQPDIDAAFAGERLGDIMRGLPATLPPALIHATKLMSRNAPLAMACALEFIRRIRGVPTIEFALGQEYRYTSRATAHGDFVEGIRAAVIDRDRNPRWKHPTWRDVTDADVLQMTFPLGPDALKLTKDAS